MLVMVLEKKTDKKGDEIGWVAPCYLCIWIKGGCTVGSGEKRGRLTSRICHYKIFFFIMVITGDLK